MLGQQHPLVVSTILCVFRCTLADLFSDAALRLDSPFQSIPFGDPRPSTSNSNKIPPPIVSDEAERDIDALPSILRKLKSLSLEYPNLTPSQIISKARLSMFDEDPNQTPPTPPPPIVLHPQPYSDSRFFTPFLLQAIILGVSALGLFARRKLRPIEGQKSEQDRLVSRTTRQEAEERVDGVQALNLLISAHAVPEALEMEERKMEVWRKEGLRPLVNLVSQAIKSEQPLNQLGVASILHFVSAAPFDTLTASSQREASTLLSQQISLSTFRYIPLSSLSRTRARTDLSSTLSAIESFLPRMTILPNSFISSARRQPGQSDSTSSLEYSPSTVSSLHLSDSISLRQLSTSPLLVKNGGMIERPSCLLQEPSLHQSSKELS